jgi:hypothetical protein
VGKRDAQIVASLIYPPIPIRQFDWMACRDGYEEDGNYGYGETKEKAIADLLAIESDEDDNA